MKLDRFYEELTEATETLGIKWRENCVGEIRWYDDGHDVWCCPITAVCAALNQGVYEPCEWLHAARKIGLRSDVAERIVSAADTSFDAIERHGWVASVSRQARLYRKRIEEVTGVTR